MRNFEINPVWGFLWSVVIGCIIGHWFILISTNPPKEQSQIKSCECLNYYQWEYYSTKRNNVLEKLYNGKKSKRKDLNDSLNFYNHKLGLDETLNVYPER